MEKAVRIQVVDSHTAGEPTRVIVAGGPELRGRTMAERLNDFRERHDSFRACVVNEPRGSDVLVGALLTEPCDPAATAGAIFFNNVGYLGMCGHGTIGIIRTLAHLNRITEGDHIIETPVGPVTATLHSDGSVSVINVASYRHRAGVQIEVAGFGQVCGDVAWGGNWFFLISDHGQTIAQANIDGLVEYCWRVRQALERAGIVGADGAEVDHIELFSHSDTADSRNFVLCPGRAYDRSPCGTGCSAKLACLADDGMLAEGAIWRQESVIGSMFEMSYTQLERGVLPTIRGRAWITAESTLIVEPDDPYRNGIV